MGACGVMSVYLGQGCSEVHFIGRELSQVTHSKARIIPRAPHFYSFSRFEERDDYDG